MRARDEGDSLGGIVEVRVQGFLLVSAIRCSTVSERILRMR